MEIPFIWRPQPSNEVQQVIDQYVGPEAYQETYAHIFDANQR